eukprot:TRINITY_DN63573_c0_g1_i2.p1 TRINITY_DN63573_c0_g1~~TRINITY_DN63573_c0_g1_i2.p1  ORF type:complete len:996 (+),score=162.14 TRINITY_DN63573_c0_g1_i2:406-2988(+)
MKQAAKEKEKAAEKEKQKAKRKAEEEKTRQENANKIDETTEQAPHAQKDERKTEDAQENLSTIPPNRDEEELKDAAQQHVNSTPDLEQEAKQDDQQEKQGEEEEEQKENEERQKEEHNEHSEPVEEKKKMEKQENTDSKPTVPSHTGKQKGKKQKPSPTQGAADGVPDKPQDTVDQKQKPSEPETGVPTDEKQRKDKAAEKAAEKAAIAARVAIVDLTSAQNIFRGRVMMAELYERYGLSVYEMCMMAHFERSSLMRLEIKERKIALKKQRAREPPSSHKLSRVEIDGELTEDEEGNTPVTSTSVHARKRTPVKGPPAALPGSPQLNPQQTVLTIVKETLKEKPSPKRVPKPPSSIATTHTKEEEAELAGMLAQLVEDDKSERGARQPTRFWTSLDTEKWGDTPETEALRSWDFGEEGSGGEELAPKKSVLTPDAPPFVPTSHAHASSSTLHPDAEPFESKALRAGWALVGPATIGGAVGYTSQYDEFNDGLSDFMDCSRYLDDQQSIATQPSFHTDFGTTSEVGVGELADYRAALLPATSAATTGYYYDYDYGTDYEHDGESNRSEAFPDYDYTFSAFGEYASFGAYYDLPSGGSGGFTFAAPYTSSRKTGASPKAVGSKTSKKKTKEASTTTTHKVQATQTPSMGVLPQYTASNTSQAGQTGTQSQQTGTFAAGQGPAAASTTTAAVGSPPGSPEATEAATQAGSPQSPQSPGAGKQNHRRCNHMASWKRLRHKKGTIYFFCTECKDKWKRRSLASLKAEQQAAANATTDGEDTSGNESPSPGKKTRGKKQMDGVEGLPVAITTSKLHADAPPFTPGSFTTQSPTTPPAPSTTSVSTTTTEEAPKQDEALAGSGVKSE